ncbi:uncharacterized protein LOC129587552 isoform X2 [Paramacrobiotus metropolitanus]|uniref:uncharacterized protein LOC129587552 isoform X2 n=1 Tax=Paramacrobiotus metropolitanus TaxID=2943436 RepID=UPI0024463216|nr:uncharacterized protein LOC129587552 isoform X2 [Paramacrobiotus metropolitanus]
MAFSLANKHIWIWAWLASFVVESSARRCSLCIRDPNDIDGSCNNHREFVNCPNTSDYCALTIKIPKMGDGSPIVTRQCTSPFLIPLPFSDASLYYCQNMHTSTETTVHCLCDSDDCNIHSRRKIMSVLNRHTSFLEQPNSTWYPFSSSSVVRSNDKAELTVHSDELTREFVRAGRITCYTCSDRNCPQPRRTADVKRGTCNKCEWQVDLPNGVNTRRSCIDSQYDTGGTGATPYMCQRIPAFIPGAHPDDGDTPTPEQLLCRCQDANLCNYHATGVMYSELRPISLRYPFEQWTERLRRLRHNGQRQQRARLLRQRPLPRRQPEQQQQQPLQPRPPHR